MSVARPSMSCALASAALLIAGLASPAMSQTEYRTPPEEIVRVIDAKPLPWISASPDGHVALLLERESLPPIREMARPMLRLAGRRIDPATNGLHGPRSIVGLTLMHFDEDHGGPFEIELPADVAIGWPIWSPTAKQFAFTVTSDEGIAMWVGDVEKAEAKPVTLPRVNPLGVTPRWLPDSHGLVVGLIPDNRPAEPPVRSPVPTGPVVQENLGGKPAPVRTYQDLLQDDHDAALFEYYFETQVAIVHTGSGFYQPVSPPGIIVGADPSPDSNYLLIERIEKPYSYLVPWYRFPMSVEIWSNEGEFVSRLADIPLAERVPIQGVITGPRSHRWRDSVGLAEVYWVEALDGGDPKTEAEHRDRLMLMSAPFEGEPEELLRLEDRFAGLSWLAVATEDKGALISEYDRDERWTRTWHFDPYGSFEPKLIFDRSVQDRYGDPGRPVTVPNLVGRNVVRMDGDSILLTGRGATPEGDRPFLDKLDLSTGETTTLWRNAGEEFEQVVDVLPRGTRFITRAETPSDPPNYYLRDHTNDERVALTDFQHPAPELLGIKKELVTYERDDGITLSATLYLPADHVDGQQHPLLVWAYPREFNDPAMASQVSGSPWRFTLFGGSSHLSLLTQGYAIMDGATMPVVGSDPETVNDTFIDQIVASAQAAIDEAVSRGVADPERVGVGGHSYGAFMTANLLAHSDLFRAGIARSGAYNRTLTPFGFQAERRTFWEAPDTYFALSPFMHADKINEPMLMIHGMEDNNSGTFPIQSERMYHAIKGHGGTARLVMLPEESHGYRARESVLHGQAEMVEWFDRWLKSSETAN